MGCWTLGRDLALQPQGTTPPTREQVRKAQPADVDGGKAKLAEFAGRLLTWIPSDVVVLYTAGVTALVAKPDDSDALWLAIVGAVAAFLVVPLASFANAADNTWRRLQTWVRAIMASIAFAIWSATVPNTVWNRIDWLAEDPARTAFVCGGGALVFSLIASGIDKRWLAQGDD